MGWKIVEIEKNCFIKYFLNNLVIIGNQRVTIPINDIDVILFSNCRMNISLFLINELVKNNVCVFFCDEKYMPSSMVFPINGNLTTLKTLEKQINWNKEFKEKLWQQIIKFKCKSQIDYLIYLNKLDDDETSKINNHYLNILENDSTNREGHIAKEYWKKLFGNTFNRQNDNDIINKILNYGYTILNGMVARSIIKKGLDCRISIFHRSVWNQFALSSDLIEPYRCVVDILVYELFANSIIKKDEVILTKETKDIILDYLANFKLITNGLYQFLNNSIDMFVDSVVNESIYDFKLEYDYEIKIEENRIEESD